MRTLLLGAFVLVGCQPNQIAADVEPVQPQLRLDTGGLWHGLVGARMAGVARGLHDVRVNEALVDATGDTFAVDVALDRGHNLIDARGTDDRGDTYVARQGVLSGDFSSPNDPIPEALTMRVNQGGLDKATELVSGFIDTETVNGALTGLNPVYQDTYELLGFDAVDITADIVSVDFDTVVITPTPRPGVLELEIVIPFVEVAANATGDIIGIDFDQDAWIGADAAIITANLMVGTQNGNIDIDLTSPNVVLEGFWYDTSLLPGDIESVLFVDTIRSTIEGMLVAKIDEMVPPLLESTLSGLDISIDTELLGRDVSMSAGFSNAAVDQNGIIITTEMDVQIPGENGHPWIGYLNAPVLAAEPSLTDDIGVSLSDNLVNSLLFQAWRSGLLELDLDSARGDFDAIFLNALGATDSAAIFVDAVLPPVLVERDGRAQVQISELQIRVDTPNGSSGEFIAAAGVAYIDIELSIENNVLILELGEADIRLDVRDSDWGADPQTITPVLAERLPIASLLGLLPDIEFALPSLAGISINQANAEREANGVYTSIGVNL